MMNKQDVFPVVALIPSLNPDEKLTQTVNGLFAAGFSHVLLVDDGSRPDCQPIFDRLAALPGCMVVHHEVNKGKGRALKTGFRYYLEQYDQSRFVGVVTADADGQHLPEDIFRSALPLMDGAVLTLGTRNFDEEQVPIKSRSGNKITTFVFKLLYGKLIHDTQTGLRGIANSYIPACLEMKGERFEYEINMLIDAARKKLDMVEIPIETVYFDSNRETHFHPIKDSVRIYRVMLASFFRFACSGLISFVVDQGIFALFQKVILAGLSAAISIPAATFIARVVSSLLNFLLNRSFVFEADKAGKAAVVRYYILCAAQMAVSAACVTVLHGVTLGDTSFLKLLVDMALFFFSYRIQQAWVFRSK